MLPHPQKHTYEEFLEITKDMERVEFIDGEIFLLASPTPEHQRISGNLFFELKSFFKNNNCEPFSAPLDVILEDDSLSTKETVQPDLMIICDKSKFTSINYNGVPSLIIEILSPSTTAIDTIKKMDLYMRFQVPEYWIVSPKSKTITLYSFDNEINAYTEPTIYSKDDLVKSILFHDLSIDLKSIFE
ncbi:MAG: Uma2 family endonuclease [Clostridiaceae bacterium]